MVELRQRLAILFVSSDAVVGAETKLELPVIQKTIGLLKSERSRPCGWSRGSCNPPQCYRSRGCPWSDQGARRRRAGRARRHQGKGGTESTKPFSRDFIVSVVVVVAIAAAVGVVYEVRRTREERAREAREAEAAASQRRRRDLSNEGGGPLPRRNPGAPEGPDLDLVPQRGRAL